MKYICFILFFNYINYFLSQDHEYLYVNVKYEDFGSNESFFVPVSTTELDRVKKLDTLLLLINKVDSQIHSVPELLTIYGKSKEEIDSVKKVLKYIDEDTSNIIFNNNNIIIKRISFKKALDSIKHIEHLIPTPFFVFDTTRSIQATYIRVNMINIISW